MCVVALALAFTARTSEINESEVIQADVTASNGVIHVIDAVLMPPRTRSDEGLTAMEESDSAAARAHVAAAAAVAYVL